MQCSGVKWKETAKGIKVKRVTCSSGDRVHEDNMTLLTAELEQGGARSSARFRFSSRGRFRFPAAGIEAPPAGRVPNPTVSERGLFNSDRTSPRDTPGGLSPRTRADLQEKPSPAVTSSAYLITKGVKRQQGKV